VYIKSKYKESKMKIKSIEETTWGRGSWSGYDGYVITLEDDTQIKMGISNGQSCCENWGYLTSEDSLEEFVGAEYLSAEVVDSKLATTSLGSVYESDCMFVNIKTSKGVLQFVAYNEHNGYYSHEAVVIENGTTTHSQSL
jgi:hypothetical protein